jgi:ABC-type sugar transport system ATPase subunit
VPFLSLQSISKSFPASPGGVRDVSLSVDAGECVAILGPSGSGKSTLLRLIAGLEQPDLGNILINGKDVTNVPPHKRGVAFVPQRPALYPQMTVSELIALPDPQPASAISTKDAIEILNLESLLVRRPHELSGGEQQRVSLARAVVRGASVWLLDEPFAALDPPFRAEFRHRLHLIAERCAATILFVTHDPVDAWALGRRVGVLGDGRLQCFGPPEELARRPGNRFVAFCLGRFCFIEGRIRDTVFESDDGSVSCPAPLTGSEVRVWLGIRPEAMSRGMANGPAATIRGWTVTQAMPESGGWNLTLSRGLSRLNAWCAGEPPAIGSMADWWTPVSQCEWFDGHDGRRIGD